MAGFFAVTLSLGAMGAAASRAQEPQPAEVLKGQGLKRSSGPAWTLPGEAAVLEGVRKAKALSLQLRDAQEQQQALELGDQNPQVLIEGLRQQIDWLAQRIGAYDQELTKLGPPAGIGAADAYYNILVRERNAIVTEQRRLGDLINNLANQRGQFQQVKRQFHAEVARLRESYLQVVDNAKTSADEITARYAELAGKPEVSRALKDLSASSKTPQKLGPSEKLAAAIKWLSKLEGSVRSESVALHREGGVDHVDVTLNGKGPFRMVFDTGAGPMTLPAGLAAQLGLKPTGRTVPLVVADGSRVMAREMIVRTAGIGRLTVKDVTCVVMPPEKGDIAPLLGQSILQRFDFKYTQGSGRLVLTKVEPVEPAPPRGKVPRGKRKRMGR
jgi:predicted aspartyl protease